MSEKIANKQKICEVLMNKAQNDKDIVVLCSDSRGSGSFTPFADTYPEQFVETGIAEQNLVSIAAGMAKAGKKTYAVSPACFLSTRSYEQCKVDVAYSDTNVKLIGISGGISYGALGMSHHSAQDIAAMNAIPNMRVYIPSDYIQTGDLIEALLEDDKPAYIRVGRNPVSPVYDKIQLDFCLDRAVTVEKTIPGKTEVLIVACGEMVSYACEAIEILRENGICASLIDAYCLKPFDSRTILKAAAEVKLVVTVEEHSPFGGLGAMTGQLLTAHCPKKQLSIALPDTPVITGTSGQVFAHYRMDGAGIAGRIMEAVR